MPQFPVPDVAGNADLYTGYWVMITDRFLPVGGTSAVAPLYAALLARIGQGLGGPCGYINELLYVLGKERQQQIFLDTTVGNNGAYYAQVGWDACTGFGSINGTALMEAFRGGEQAPAADETSSSEAES